MSVSDDAPLYEQVRALTEQLITEHPEAHPVEVVRVVAERYHRLLLTGDRHGLLDGLLESARLDLTRV